jgi:hypothetical protein
LLRHCAIWWLRMANRGSRDPVSPGSNSDECSARYEMSLMCQFAGGRARYTDIAWRVDCRVICAQCASRIRPAAILQLGLAACTTRRLVFCALPLLFTLLALRFWALRFQTELFDATPMNFAADMLQVFHPVRRDLSEVARGPIG